MDVMKEVLKMLDKRTINIMEKNNVCLNDREIMRDEYIDGSIGEYEMTFSEVLYGCGINDAILYWNDINPYCDEVSYEKELELGLIDEEEYEEYKQMEREIR